MTTDLTNSQNAGAEEAAYESLQDRLGPAAWDAIKTARTAMTDAELSQVKGCYYTRGMQLNHLAAHVHTAVACLDVPPTIHPHRFDTPDHFEDVVTEANVADALAAMGLLSFRRLAEAGA